MNPFSHMLSQISSQPRRLPPKPSTKAEIPPCIIRHGKLIDERYKAGEKLVDIARDMGLAYGGVRSMYSIYRRAKTQGLV